MKKSFLIILLLSTFNILFSQENKSVNNNVNKDISDFLSLSKNINYLNINGYYFVDLPVGKDYKSRLSGEILIEDTSKIDLVSLDVNFSFDDYKYYFVTNLNLLLVIKSIRHIKNEINLND
tara:strand:- start:250 stop:612 length:363 start_codon:yes stop_codon:yes gene_type:complete